jgi:hypothetical protein
MQSVKIIYIIILSLHDLLLPLAFPASFILLLGGIMICCRCNSESEKVAVRDVVQRRKGSLYASCIF